MTRPYNGPEDGIKIRRLLAYQAGIAAQERRDSARTWLAIGLLFGLSVITLLSKCS